ncbi:hypothetical protein J2W21_001252 [Sinomonas atrocyanea]|uniref:hypothetical protein n=1 Tax=Sinomonas atrocyanea TaxID=37927 RepID=UPI002789EEB2|nr:hypothetical protein [Sinomonas atrocyanea]MDP9883758.1 hypothetical protein [Sinomonas atrocyanea]
MTALFPVGLPALVPSADLASAPQWWEIVAALAPVGTLAAALVAAVVGLGTIRQRSYSDRRAEFWRRTEWALEASTSQDPQLAAMGTMVLASLAKSDLIASDEELQLLDAVWIDPIAEAEEAGLDEELGDGDEDRAGDEPGPERP